MYPETGRNPKVTTCTRELYFFTAMASERKSLVTAEPNRISSYRADNMTLYWFTRWIPVCSYKL